MYTLHKFHFLNGISEINQLFDDILIIWPAPVYILYIAIMLNWNGKLNPYDFLSLTTKIIFRPLFDTIKIKVVVKIQNDLKNK